MRNRTYAEIVGMIIFYMMASLLIFTGINNCLMLKTEDITHFIAKQALSESYSKTISDKPVDRFNYSSKDKLRMIVTIDKQDPVILELPTGSHFGDAFGESLSGQGPILIPGCLYVMNTPLLGRNKTESIPVRVDVLPVSS